MKTIAFKVFGKVQQVFFRQYTLNKAKELGLTGWVKNLPDKTVTGMATGSDEALKMFEQWLWKGSPLSRVEKVEIIETNEVQQFDDFNIL